MPDRVAPWDDPEAHLLAQVRDLARRTGWRTYHTLRSTGSEPGFPDLVLLRPSRDNTLSECLVVELKAGRGQPTTEQAAWLADFAKVPGIATAVWYPQDWPTIVERLTRPRVGRPPGGRYAASTP